MSQFPLIEDNTYSIPQIMSFSSFQFWVVFPFLFALYWLIPINWLVLKKVFLLLASITMYMLWNPIFVIVMACVCFLTFFAGLVSDNSCEINKQWLIVLLVVLAITPLAVFKYWNWIASTVNSLSLFRIQIPGLNWAVPVGISFYTFQAIGYVLDVSRGSIKAEKNLLDYSLFISFFPQIMCGPISKGEELIPQLKSPRKFDFELASSGFHLLIWGMFMKFVVADRIGLLVDSIYSNPSYYSGANNLVATLLYSFQIYGDFAGYSFMAVGIAGLLGIKLINNFKRPYLALTITDFWKRWHISLTRWLKDNVYIPLGGNRRGEVRTYLNILLTFLVSGIWHGAAWTFVIWGIFHGLFQCVEKIFGLSKTSDVSVVRRIGMTMCSYVLVSFLWVFFRAPSLMAAFAIFERIFYSFGRLDFKFIGTDYIYNLYLVLPIVFFKDLYDEFIRPMKPIRLFENEAFKWVLSVLVLAMVLAFGVLDSSQFIYSGF